MRRYVFLILVLSICCPALPAADELDALIASAKPPARFKDHKPAFKAEQREVDSLGPKGLEKVKRWFIQDGARQVAMFDDGLSQLDVVAFDPDKAPEQVDVPPMYTWARLLGTRISTVLWWDTMGPSADEHSAAFSGGGETLVLTVKERWTKKRQAESEYVFTLRCDPVLGYVFDIRTWVSSNENGPFKKDRQGKERPAAPEFLNVQPGGVSSPWPDRWKYDRTVWTPAGGNSIRGWWNNLVAGDRSDNGGLPMRNGGYVAFVDDKESVALVRADTGALETFNSTCNYWLDQHNMIRFPDRADADGRFVIDARWRLAGLPAEVCGEIIQKVEMNDFGGQRAVMIRLGVMEDFEEQPLAMTTRARALWNWDVPLSDRQVHSGKKSMLVKGTPREAIKFETGRFIAPFIPLEKDATYQIDAWMLVEGEGTEAYLANGFPKPDADRVGKQRSESVKAGTGWKQITWQIPVGPNGGSFDLRFVAVGGGTAYVDDFHFRRVK